MSNESPLAHRFTWLLAALLVESVALAGCVGDQFQIGGGAGGGGGTGGSGGDEPKGGGGGGGSEPVGGGGAGGDTGGGPPSVPVTWPDSPTKRCTDGTVVLEQCPGPSEPFFGQDGNYEIAVPSYTERDGTVRDSVTRLIWEKPQESATFTFDAARVHCDALSAEQHGGVASWRLPTLRELVSVIDFGHTTAFQDIFATTPGSVYWSATDVVDTGGAFAWGVLTTGATIGYYEKEGMANARVLCVGGEQAIPPADFSTSGEEWALDSSTGLVWQRQHALGTFDWRSALAHCEDLTLAGKSDWRLPSAKELLSIVDDRRIGPAIDTEIFLGSPSSSFWSSTPALGSADRAIVVNFNNGASQDNSVRDRRLTRCVRSDR
ncbi:DUF1566 domain-containing protein [Sorangium sp. So ce1024]|uniref:Lcl C-terminal domain-containing protein n=1 Tax=Sorangium sp. So ce1024 TaxID=3133327 RepID=UPI003F09A669